MNSIKDIEKVRCGMDEKGYAALNGVFNPKAIELILSDIDQSSGVVKYFDRRQNERRIEKIFDKGYSLSQANLKILNILESIYGFEWMIFKDKYNSKPSGGEGFFAHFDGIFIFTDKHGEKRNGWYTYADKFINVLVAIDDFTHENGPLEIAPKVKGTFHELLEHTKKDGTPNLTPSFEDQCSFERILLKSGDLLFFDSKCPHRSKANISQLPRRTLYYTYNASCMGDQYERYYEEKNSGRNSNSKSLTGEILQINDYY